MKPLVPPAAFVTLLLSSTSSAQEYLGSLGGGETGDRFGYQVVLDGPERLLVSAPYRDVGTTSGVGGGFVFARRAGAWTLEGALDPLQPFADDHLGVAADLSGDLVLMVDEDHGLYVFERGPSGWEEEDLVWPPAVTNTSDANRAVAIAGDSLLLGVYKTNFFSGGVFCFDRTPSGWVEVPGPEPIGGILSGSRFGAALDWDAASGRLAVGAIADGGGAVLIFERPGGVWTEVAKIQAPTNNGFFGWAVDLDGDEIAIGAPYRNYDFSEAGTVQVFRRSGSGTWNPASPVLVASDRAEGAHFGTDVELAGHRLVIGSPGAQVGANCEGSSEGCTSGAIYVFHRSAGAWHQSSKLGAPAGGGGGFGFSVALEEAALVVGNRSPVLPEVYEYDLPSEVLPYGNCVGPAPCGNEDAFGGCANSTGLGARLGSTGSVSVASDDLVLRATFVPPNRIGLLFMGASRISAPLGDGFLLAGAAGGGLYRFQPHSSGPGGVLTLGPGIATVSASLPPGGQVAAGSTWHFQAYYRDQNGPCGSGSNLSSALRVQFQP